MQPVMRKALIGVALLACAILSADAAATVYTKPTKLPRQGTVVVLGRDQDKASHGKFFGALENLVGAGNVQYTTTLSQLKKYGEYTYSNVILFGVQNDLSVDFLDFVDNGNGNVVVIARPQDEDDDESFPESQRDMAIECGVLFTEKNVEDAFGTNPSVVVAGDFLDSKPVTGGKKLQPVHYHGLGLQLERNNPLLLPILRAPRTAVVPGEDEAPQLIGGDIVLVAGLQARNGARMTFAGSTELFHDKSPAANHAFAAELLQWALQFRGVLRYTDVEHRHKDLTVAHAHETYRIKDVVEYTVKIEEFTGKAWEPYVADDIQIEVVMLDPYIRTALKYDAAKQRYTADLHLPDVYGIFKFLVDYRRPGYAPLVYYNTTTIRPLKLNEYERFIPSAFPYYSTVFLCMGGFFLFSVLFFGAEGGH